MRDTACPYIISNLVQLYLPSVILSNFGYKKYETTIKVQNKSLGAAELDAQLNIFLTLNDY